MPALGRRGDLGVARNLCRARRSAQEVSTGELRTMKSTLTCETLVGAVLMEQDDEWWRPDT